MLLDNMKKLSKPGESLQQKYCSFMTESLTPLSLFPVRVELTHTKALKQQWQN